jgi:protein-S-isoprenylcysteine O-methyltransferase Ste14
MVISMAWRTLDDARKEHRLATTGLYAHVRHLGMPDSSW